MWFFSYLVTDPEVPAPRRQPMLSLENLRPGAELWLDGVDGFGDQFFECRTAGEELTFIALHAGALPHDVASFELLPIVHARLVNVVQYAVDALAVIERVQPLGEWSRTVGLGAADTLGSVPGALRPDAALVATVRRHTLWISPVRVWRTGLPGAKALYVCRDAVGAERCVVIAARHELCHLVQL